MQNIYFYKYFIKKYIFILNLILIKYSIFKDNDLKYI
jgi:hypothetical protein